ncbi:uncharacterized protein LOC125224347 [Salvia hispanica]|uniref:uncharacterized protein LOC125224347 n=1 Tax=Salvia hispanica TaxID=49212 RepID=UPI002009794B|nr:uncharacterized protein LOC125224347 [Salvia hispanica]
MYPIAWAVVEVENEVCWSWFVNILTQDLNLGDGEGITILSDQQKGLENAVKDLLPMAEHRNCARHIYANWKKTHKGPALKQHFWKIVRSTYMEEYDGACHELEKEDGQAYADLMDKNPSKFCKAFLTPVQCSDAILNNVCECFNSYILEARNKHIIDMLEEIRIALMERLYRKNVEIKSAERSSSICPKIRKKIEAMVYESRNCTTIPAIGGKFEVKHFQDRFVVIPTLRKCGCRKWELTGIPCVHGCAVINFLKQNMDDYVNEWFSVGKYKLAYGYGLPALNGEKLWPAAEGLPVIPPPIRKMPGRPKKVRRRDPYEKEPERPNKLRKTCQMTCQNCFQEGHNSRTCKNDTVHLPPKPKGKKGRPRKAPLQSTTPATTAIPGRGRGGGRGGGGRGGGRGGGGRGGGRGGSIPTQESNTNT